MLSAVLAPCKQSGTSAEYNAFLVGLFIGEQQRETFTKMPPTSPQFFLSSGSASMSGIYQGLPRWVQTCLCLSGMAFYNLRNVDES